MELNFHSIEYPQRMAVIRDLLNRVFKLRLQFSFTGVNPGDMFHQYSDGFPKVAVSLIDIGQDAEAIAQSISRRYYEDIELAKPEEYVIVVLREIPERDQKVFDGIIADGVSKVRVYDIRWVEDQLAKHPDIAEKHRLTLKAEIEKTSMKAVEEVRLKEDFRGNIYAGGSTWHGNQDQTLRFLDNGIWENGYDEDGKFHEEVNAVSEGDIFILKSTYAKKKQGQFRVKALGIVTKNLKDGTHLEVNWIVRTGNIDIPGHLAAKQRTILSLSLGNLLEILQAIEISSDDFNALITAHLQQVELSSASRGTSRTGQMKDGLNYWWFNVFEGNFENMRFGIGGAPSTVAKYPLLSQKRWQENSHPNAGDLMIGFDEASKRALSVIAVASEPQYNEKEEFVMFMAEVRHSKALPLDWEQLSQFPGLKEEGISFKLAEPQEISQALFEAIANGEQSSEKEEAESVDDSTENVERKEQPTPVLTDEDTYAAKDLLDDEKDVESFATNPGDTEVYQPRSVHNSNDLAHADKDLLDFEPDVKVLAALIALKKMDPPMAIALFGKWGTGKSFFMHYLEQKINELSDFQGFLEPKREDKAEPSVLDSDKYCQGIAQIKFNAWSYVDSDLWAGLVSSIFEKLNEYITDSTKSEVAKLKVQEKLGERLKSYQKLRETEEQKTQRLKALQRRYEMAAQQLEQKLPLEIGQQLLELSSADERLIQAHRALGEDAEAMGEYFKIEGYNLVSEYRYARRLLRNLSKLRNLLPYLALAFAGALLLGMSLWFFDELAAWWGMGVATIPGPVTLAGIWIWNKRKKVRVFVDQFNASVEKSEDMKREVLKLRSEIEDAEAQQDVAKQRIAELDKEIEEINSTVAENLTEATIHDFIGERASHEDYKDHLGIVSVIRKDFETLSALFLESKEEETKKQDEANLAREKKLKEDRKIIHEQFKEGKKLERIVLYIDDLDRCSDQKVLEVLQAVHLLMAFPLFIVVVGVDKRCVNNALNYKNILQYFKATGLNKVEQLKDEFDIEAISPNEYLEKIFQIPFQVPEAQPDGVHRMIDHLFEGQVKEKPEVASEQPTSQEEVLPVEDVRTEQADESFDFGDVEKDNESLDKAVALDEDDLELTDSERKKENPKADFPEEYEPQTPPDLEIYKDELEQIKKLSGLVGKTPRTVKRFVNLYRLLRAHSELKHDSLSDREKLAILFTLAINIGEHKEQAEKLFKAIESLSKEPLSERLTLETYPEFVNVLTENRMEVVLDLTCAEVNERVPFVKRFSFGEVGKDKS